MICTECGLGKRLVAKGLCSACYHRQWRAAHVEERRESVNRHAAKQQAKNPEWRYGRWLVHRYGITLAEYYDRLDEQGGVCAICKGAPTMQKKWLSVDHCHATGMVRGLLCDNCNVVLGKMKDDPARLRRAAEYVEASLSV